MPFGVRSDGFAGRTRLPFLLRLSDARPSYFLRLGCDGNVGSIQGTFVLFGAISSQVLSDTLLVSSCWSHGVQLEKSNRMIRERDLRVVASNISIIL
jgi:hypothetical protein